MARPSKITFLLFLVLILGIKGLSVYAEEPTPAPTAVPETTAAPTEAAKPAATPSLRRHAFIPPREIPFNIKGTAIYGSWSNRYRFRATSDESDQDFETLLSLDIGEPMMDRISAALQVGGVFDLDGLNQSNVFSSPYDTFSTRAVERIYYAYVNIKDLKIFEQAKVGRQSNFDFQPLYFDGVWLESKGPRLLKFTLYGGVPVHLFETRLGSDPGDWLIGSSLTLTPNSFLQLRGDLIHLRDEVTGFRADIGDKEDTLYGTQIWLTPTENIRLSSRFTAFSDQARDLNIDGSILLPAPDLTLSVRYYSLLNSLGVRTIDFETFGFIGSYEPYSEMQAALSKGFGEHFRVETGAAARWLWESPTASNFNHGYKRYFISASTYAWPWTSTNLNVVADYYSGEDNILTNDTFAASGNVEQQLLGDRVRLNLGSAYYIYRFNPATAIETDQIQVYFARLRARLASRLEGRIGYEFENNDLNGFHSVDVRAIWHL